MIYRTLWVNLLFNVVRRQEKVINKIKRGNTVEPRSDGQSLEHN